MNKEEKARQLMSTAVKNGKLVNPGICEICGSTWFVEGHHRDYDKPLIITWICRSCHMIEDGRMKMIHIKPTLEPKKCIVCGRLQKPLRKGRCHTCNEYYRRHKKERPFKIDGRTEKHKEKGKVPCKKCGRESGIVGTPIMGYCRSCYTYLHRSGIKKKINK